MIVVDIANEQTYVPLDETWFRTLVEFVCEQEEVPLAHFSLAFVDNERIHELNREYLEHDYPTDVLTFPLSEADQPLEGEIVLSPEYAIGEAADAGWSPQRECALYVVHGILHLLDYDDLEEPAATQMQQRQQELLAAFWERQPHPQLSQANAMQNQSEKNDPEIKADDRLED